MSPQRPLVLASAALGALALLGVGIWFGRSSAASTATVGPRAGLAEEREAAYRRLIEEANARITRQNQLLAAAQTSPAVKAEAAKPPSMTPATIEPNAAAAAAYRRAPGARLSRPPELVSFRGQPAYEVVLDRGTVYVDAATSEVLHDGTTPATRAAGGEHDDERAAPLAMNGKHKRKHHEEHEEEHEDDDD